MPRNKGCFSHSYPEPQEIQGFSPPTPCLLFVSQIKAALNLQLPTPAGSLQAPKAQTYIQISSLPIAQTYIQIYIGRSSAQLRIWGAGAGLT